MIFYIRFSRFTPQREAKCRTVIDDALGPDFTLMAVDDSLYGRQPYARATKLTLIVQTLEWREQIAGARHVETRAVVAHKIGLGAIGLRERPKFNARTGMICRELPRIAEQILQHDSQ